MYSTLMMFVLLRRAYQLIQSPRRSLIWRRERAILLKGYVIYKLVKELENSSRERRFWVHPIFRAERRLAQGVSDNLIVELENVDHDKYFEYLRMTPENFEELFQLVKPFIEKNNVVREPIPAKTRLQICLRYLAGGGTLLNISFIFRVGLNTVSKIIAETCEVIWEVLSPGVFPAISEEMWLQKAAEFNCIWNFPHCIGAIDGRHMEIQAPPHSGSTYFNYKKTHSLVLLAVVDANGLFILVDIGAEGRRNDGGIFHSSEWGQHFENKTIMLPDPRPLPNDGPMEPFFLVGDEAFGLSDYMMRPYPKAHHLDTEKRVFNYRLSRARRIVECAFGILVSKWRIFKQPMATKVDTSEKIIQATVCLHNFIMEKELRQPVENRRYMSSDISSYGREEDQPTGNNEDFGLSGSPVEDEESPIVVGNAATIRDDLKKYFLEKNILPNQWDRALLGDF